MRTIVDFHIHSKYARATSKHLDLLEIARWSRRKGINIVSTGDFTHPRWFDEITSSLVEDGSGLLSLPGEQGVKFILGTEVACIYRHRDATRRLHHVVLAPDIDAVKKINAALTARGCKLASDGRPVLGLSSKELLQILLEADPRSLLIPAHIWTPWFALFGSKSGYDRIEDCFEDLTPHIVALETGLSSDPEMNWAWSALDRYVLVSNSDAHSGPNLGREANVFDLRQGTYGEIRDILAQKDKTRFLFTIEFFPEEGMYHFDGHRLCAVRFDPEQTKRAKAICPVCKKQLTIGVLHRVDKLRDRDFGTRPENAIPFKKIVPLPEIIAEYLQTGDQSKKVLAVYMDALMRGGNEFHLLLDATLDELHTVFPEDLAEGIIRMRAGTAELDPGFDGNYGTVSLFSALKRGSQRQPSLL